MNSRCTVKVYLKSGGNATFRRVKGLRNEILESLVSDGNGEFIFNEANNSTVAIPIDNIALIEIKEDKV